MIHEIEEHKEDRENTPSCVSSHQGLERLLEVQLANKVNFEACSIVFDSLVVLVVNVS
jgi:hypothetical protein